MTSRFEPTSTIIAFDLHGVLVRHAYGTMLIRGLQTPGLCRLLLQLANPRVWWLAFTLHRQGAVAEHLLMKISTQFPGLQRYRHTGIRILNAQKPIPGAIELIKNLKHNGYEVHLFSNIGEHLFADFSAHHQELVSLFDRVHTTQEYNNYLAKPSTQAFKKYLHLYNPNQKQVIFIDNSTKNIQAAQQCGITGVFYKNIRQVTKTLNDMLRQA